MDVLSDIGHVSDGLLLAQAKFVQTLGSILSEKKLRKKFHLFKGDQKHCGVLQKNGVRSIFFTKNLHLSQQNLFLIRKQKKTHSSFSPCSDSNTHRHNRISKRTHKHNHSHTHSHIHSQPSFPRMHFTYPSLLSVCQSFSLPITSKHLYRRTHTHTHAPRRISIATHTLSHTA